METLDDGGGVNEVARAQDTHDVWVQVRDVDLGAVVHPAGYTSSTTAACCVPALLTAGLVSGSGTANKMLLFHGV